MELISDSSSEAFKLKLIESPGLTLALSVFILFISIIGAVICSDGVKDFLLYEVMIIVWIVYTIFGFIVSMKIDVILMEQITYVLCLLIEILLVFVSIRKLKKEFLE